MSLFMLVVAVSQAHFNLVTPVSIEQIRPMDLGMIYNQANVNCQLDQFNRQGNGCLTSDNQLGQFKIQGNGESSINVRVYPTSTSNVLFTPILPNGNQQQSFALSETATIINVGGKVDVLNIEDVGQQQLSYTIEVNYH
ncbi:hypothetical protein J8L86_02695 [Shewanella sp. MMG014]|uniref:hypothetical protein n=1 Tax=Shewanella sp. MMG014 TaxID=2822691 RepID=UPI001B372DA7|nr:hypothetical protein [Shewanella sp. MMG014]MBQ4888737.1 hypothetical protein [Shewanella sp. MMG014]